jgi:uncharacterized protein YutE (UPF0331/DUF86 family)
MTNRDLIEKKLAFIERTLRELRTQGRPAAIETELREQRFIERQLQLAIQAALDVASHIVSDHRFEEPTTNAALFGTLAKHGFVPEQLRGSLEAMAKFRNVLVHGYVDVNPAIVRDIAVNRIGDLDAFVAAIRARLTTGT